MIKIYNYLIFVKSHSHKYGNIIIVLFNLFLSKIMISTIRSVIRSVNGVNLILTRGLKSDLHIKWVRPEKIACWDAKKSGDLVPLEPLDMTKFPLEYQDSEELKT